VHEIRDSYCDSDPLAALPIAGDLAIRYTDVEPNGLDEGRFVIGRLDMTTASWVPLERRANDPAEKVVGATIIETVVNLVWEACRHRAVAPAEPAPRLSRERGRPPNSTGQG